MRKFLKVLFYFVAALYPVLVFTFLVILKIPARLLSLCVIALAAAFFLSFTGSSGAVKGKDGKKKFLMNWRPLFSSVLFLAAGILCFAFNQKVFLKLYSVAVNATLLIVFGSTLFFKPNIIFRFATLADKSIKGSSFEADKNIKPSPATKAMTPYNGNNFLFSTLSTFLKYSSIDNISFSIFSIL